MKYFALPSSYIYADDNRDLERLITLEETFKG